MVSSSLTPYVKDLDPSSKNSWSYQFRPTISLQTPGFPLNTSRKSLTNVVSDYSYGIIWNIYICIYRHCSCQKWVEKAPTTMWNQATTCHNHPPEVLTQLSRIQFRPTLSLNNHTSTSLFHWSWPKICFPYAGWKCSKLDSEQSEKESRKSLEVTTFSLIRHGFTPLFHLTWPKMCFW